MAQWLALSPQNKEALGLNPGQPDPFCAVLACSAAFVWVYSWYSGFLHTKRHASQVRCAPTIALHQGIVHRTGVGPWALHCSCQLPLSN